LIISTTNIASAKKPTTTGPAQGSVSIQSIAFEGDGCPPGSATASLSPDGQAFTVIFSGFGASAGPTAKATDASHRCQLHVKVAVPKGWSYALSGVDFRGYVQLDPGVVASQQARYHLSGESPETTAAYTWQGAYDDDYAVRDIGATSPLYWSGCGKGKNLEIVTEVKVDNAQAPTQSGFLAVDSIDGEVFHLQWRACGG
jgi:hypothetical protein